MDKVEPLVAEQIVATGCVQMAGLREMTCSISNGKDMTAVLHVSGAAFQFNHSLVCVVGFN